MGVEELLQRMIDQGRLEVSSEFWEGTNNQNHHCQVHCSKATIILQCHIGEADLEYVEICYLNSLFNHEVLQR